MNKVLLHKNSNKMIVQVAVNIFKEDDMYIADCPALKLSTQGKSIEIVQKRFKEALDLWVESVLNRKTVHESLVELGWSMSPIPHPVNQDFRKVPIELLAQNYYPISIPKSAFN